MNRERIIIALGSLCLGALIGVVSAGRATAQGGPRRYEYTCVPAVEKPWKQEGQMKLNGMGAMGWELVQQMTSNPDVFCFKRPLMY